MGKTGVKRILIKTNEIKEVEYLIQQAQKKAKGVKINLKYQFGKGLEISIRGTRDNIFLFEHEIRDLLSQLDSEKLNN